jgi:hypothetical protein
VEPDKSITGRGSIKASPAFLMSAIIFCVFPAFSLLRYYVPSSLPELGKIRLDRMAEYGLG